MNPIKKIIKKRSRESIIKEAAEELDVPEQLVNDILNNFVLRDTLKEIKEGGVFVIPDAFYIMVKKKYVKKPETEYERLKRKRLDPKYRKRHNYLTKRSYVISTHNMWREMNGCPPKRKRIKRNSLVRRTMPSIKKVRALYKEFKKEQENNVK